jgi:4-hydroxy-3-methylbut-2-en-1-yl diphosphate reductase
MNIHLARHYGMCFGVRDALRATHDAAKKTPVTILGQLVHNPVVDEHLRALGVRQGELSNPGSASTRDVIITAHGASEAQRASLVRAGLRVTDTTCPLVRKAHDALAVLVGAGYFPVVIGQASHVEVRGLTGDFPGAAVVLDDSDVARVPFHPRIGVISQTTQPVARALELVELLKRRHPLAAIRFVDTICHPTKQRQRSLEELCTRCDTVVVIGGRNSNNTRQLTRSAQRPGCRAFQVEGPDDLQPVWFRHSENVGVTAGTSTLDETVRAVLDRLQAIAAEAGTQSLWSALFGGPRPSAPSHDSCPKTPGHPIA